MGPAQENGCPDPYHRTSQVPNILFPLAVDNTQPINWILAARPPPPGPGLVTCDCIRILNEAMPSGASLWAWGGQADF
eukprot:scaffold24467_cov16-Tisochrysis_lutea.AAC.2